MAQVLHGGAFLCKKEYNFFGFLNEKTDVLHDITDKYELTFYVGRIPLVHKIDMIHKCDIYDMTGISDMSDKTYKSDRCHK